MSSIKDQLRGGIVSHTHQGHTGITTAGYKDHTNQLEIDSDTRFPTASVGKIFTAVGVLYLIEQGVVSLDSTLGEIASFDLGTMDPSVTVKELLTHTSGIHSYFDEEKHPNYADLWKTLPNYSIRQGSDLFPLFTSKPMMYPHGDHFSYNDSGFVVLGVLIEQYTKKPFCKALEDIIFKPLKMNRTGYYELDRLPENTANAYIYDEETKSYYTNIYSIDAKGSGAGGAFTTVADMNKFWEGLLTYQVLSKEMVETMLTPHVPFEHGGYGLGVWLDEDYNPYVVGEDPGVTAISWTNRSLSHSLTIFSNYQDNVFSLFDQIKEQTKK
jgi:CubicO group peptidase (beta-lactamase class C family)